MLSKYSNIRIFGEKMTEYSNIRSSMFQCFEYIRIFVRTTFSIFAHPCTGCCDVVLSIWVDFSFMFCATLYPNCDQGLRPGVTTRSTEAPVEATGDTWCNGAHSLQQSQAPVPMLQAAAKSLLVESAPDRRRHHCNCSQARMTRSVQAPNINDNVRR